MGAMDAAWLLLKQEIPPYEYNEEDAYEHLEAMGADEQTLDSFNDDRHVETWHPKYPLPYASMYNEKALHQGLRGRYGREGVENAKKYMSGDLMNNPVVVYIDRHGNEYVIDGHHRTSAHFLAGKESIPAVVLREQE